MTMKEIFKKIETYNEVAEMMHTDKARIYFVERMGGALNSGKHFNDFAAFRKWIRYEWQKEVADKVLKFDGWDFGEDITFDWHRGTVTFAAELTAN